MRIVDRKTFLAMPAGTVFAKYEPCVFGEMLIKGESLPDDFCYQSIVDAIECTSDRDAMEALFQAEHTGMSIPMDFDCQGRDGCFDQDQLFAVFESADVVKLIERLRQALLHQST